MQETVSPIPQFQGCWKLALYDSLTPLPQVFSSRNEVLLVQETVSPIPQLQGCWKLPGGLADPGEDFMQTARREVLEETGVDGEPMGVVTLRHSHGYRFGQGDVYVTVRVNGCVHYRFGRSKSVMLRVDRGGAGRGGGLAFAPPPACCLSVSSSLSSPYGSN